MIKNPITPEEQAQILGLKLAFLIDSLNLPLEQKEAFFDILDFASLKELENLASLLETVYLNEKTKTIDNSFTKAVARIARQDQKESKNLLQRTLKDLENIALELKALDNQKNDGKEKN
ncbi:MAG: hypothetical protein PHU56_00305 [Candidatus Pacebacteria bacterium]|nr:hypothetical protein [Candidatus Paceibacterota bacterium]